MKGELFNCLHSVHSRNREEPAYHVRTARLRRLLCGGEILTASLSVMHVVFITSYIRLVIIVFLTIYHAAIYFLQISIRLYCYCLLHGDLKLSFDRYREQTTLTSLFQLYLYIQMNSQVIRALVYCAEGLLF